MQRFGGYVQSIHGRETGSLGCGSGLLTGGARHLPGFP